MPLPLIDYIQNEMEKDDEDRDDQSARLKNVYEEASEEAKKSLDAAFICLCGWGLKTCIELAEEGY